MEDIKIEKNISIPGPRGLSTRYPWLKKLETGDSVCITNLFDAQRIRENLSHYSKRHGLKFTTRKTQDGLRIWRLK